MSWSDQKKSNDELTSLGVEFVRYGANHNLFDGDCDLVYRHTRSGEEFRLQDNYYRVECYEPVLVWARGKVSSSPSTQTEVLDA